MNPDANRPQENGGDNRKAAGWIVATAIGLPLLYVLSVGPAARVYGECNRTFGWSGKYDPIMDAVYAPIVYLVKNTKAGEKIIMWYVIDVWGSR